MMPQESDPRSPARPQNGRVSLRNLRARLAGLGSRLHGSRRFRRFRTAGSFPRPGRVAGYLGWLDDGNLGDEALFESFLELFPSLEIIRADLPPPVELSLWAALRRRRLQDFVFLGGGTLIGHDWFLDRLRLQRRRGHRAVVFGTGVSDPAAPEKPTGMGAGLQAWAAELSTCAYVGVRGARSARLLADAGLPGVEVVGDPAICLAEAPATAPPFQARLAVNLGFHDWMRGDADALILEVGRTCRTLLARGWRVDFLPLHRRDVEMGLRLRREPGLTGLPMAPLDGVSSLLSRLLSYDVVLAQRLHAAVLATASGVPTLSLEYRPKCAEYMESIGALRHCRPTDGARADELVDRLEALGRDHAAERDGLVRAVGALRLRLRSAAGAALRAGLDL